MTALLHAIAPYLGVLTLMWLAVCFCVIVIAVWRYIRPAPKTTPFIHYGGD